MPSLQPVPVTNSRPPPPPSLRVSLSSQPDLGAPREWSIVSRYLHDPSLRYTKIPFAGPAPLRMLVQSFAFFAGLAIVVLPLVHQAMSSGFTFWSLASIVGIPLCLESVLPFRDSLLELQNKLKYGRAFRVVDLGLDRAVPQPGTSLRYEVHLAARRRAKLGAVHVRLVFWESWRGRGRLRFLRVPIRKTEKRGHDLVRQELGPIELTKGQHAVIRGAIRIPDVRPTEHYRGKPRHISYVNVTVTLVSEQLRPVHTARGNCPHLVTFPWM